MSKGEEEEEEKEKELVVRSMKWQAEGGGKSLEITKEKEEGCQCKAPPKKPTHTRLDPETFLGVQNKRGTGRKREQERFALWFG